MMNLVYFFVAGGLAVWLWILRPTLAERGWSRLHWWATSGAVAGALVAAGTLSDFFSGKQSPDIGLFFLSLVVATGLVNIARNAWAWLAGKLGLGGRDENHVRGSSLIDEKQAARGLRGQPSRFSVGAVPVPRELETRGFLLAGAPGTGKSQTLTSALDALRADDARAIVADASGIYTSRFFDKDSDVIVNPFDSRSAPWSPIAEIESVADIPALAKSLVPDAEGSAAEWNSYAQTFVEAALEHCFLNNLTNADLFHFLIVADIAELREICASTPAQPLVAEGNERMFGSVRGIVGSATKFIQYLSPEACAKDGFSIRRHIVEERQGWIFLSYQQQHRDALKSMIGCCTDVAARAVLSLPPDPARRVIFALDELPLLGKVQSIVDLVTNGRKHGAMIFAGLQTIAQVRESYGLQTAQTLLACLGSWLVLRVADAETAEYMSCFLGDEEKTRIVKSGGQSTQTMNVGGSKSDNWQEQVVKDRVVLPSELQQLPDLRGIFNLAGPTPAAVVNLQIAPQRTVADAFVAAQPRQRVKPAATQKQTEAAPAAEAELDLL